MASKISVKLIAEMKRKANLETNISQFINFDGQSMIIDHLEIKIINLRLTENILKLV